MSHNGITMLELMLARLKRLKCLKPIIIATSTKKIDKKIIYLCKKKKIKYFVGSEKNVLARYYFASKKYKLKNVIRLTSDCPLIDINIIKKLIKIFKTKKFNFVANTVPPPTKFPDGTDVEIFSQKLLEKTFKEAKLPSEKEHVTFYMWKSGKFKTFKLENKSNYSKYRFTLDYPKDFILITKIMDYFKDQIYSCTTNQIVNFIKKNKKLIKYQKKISRYDGWKPSLKKDKIFKK